MSTTAEALRALKRKHDEEDTMSKRQTEWLGTQFTMFQNMVKDCAAKGKTEDWTYISFYPTKECMETIQKTFEGCNIDIEHEDKNLYRLSVSWKEEITYQEQEDKQEEEEEDNQEEDNQDEEKEFIPAKSDDEIKERIQNEMYTFFEKNKSFLGSYSSEWVNNMKKGTINAIPDRGYTWQEK